MSIMTVRGLLDAEALGVTLAHEHLFIDLRNQFTEPQDPERRRIAHGPITLATSGILRRSPYAIRDNLLLDDLELAVEEVNFFRAAGGQSLVECTSIGIRPDPKRLRQVSERTGVHVIAGCGYYTQDTHPPEVAQQPAEALAERMLHDLLEGIDGTNIRAGIIGEIGTSEPIHPDEEKVLRAAALAFRQVRAAIYVHIYPWGRGGLRATDLLVAGGVDPAKIVICHGDVEFDPAYLRAVLKRGAFLEFDDFGKEFYVDPPDRGFAGGIFARDIERVRLIRTLVDEGYAAQLLITNDICLKSMLHAYGGWGYDHILTHIVPMLRDEGISQEAIDLFLVANPRRLLDLDA